jgi:hypothetical protein
MENSNRSFHLVRRLVKRQSHRPSDTRYAHMRQGEFVLQGQTILRREFVPFGPDRYA